MNKFPERLSAELEKRSILGNRRALSFPDDLIDFASNDYLGLAKNLTLRKQIEVESQIKMDYSLGATGSRLLTGNTEFSEELEQALAQHYRAESALIFNSGYMANLGLLSTVVKREDTLIYDVNCHASIREGIQLSRANNYGFKHNDLNDLRKKLRKGQGQKYVVVESVYSMEGDIAPLKSMVSLCNEENALLIVDEAHATGIYGEKGEGLCVQEGLEQSIFARVYTFGKAIGHHGAIVAGSRKLKDYLINFSKSFIYTTALPYHSLVCIKEAVQFAAKSDELRKKLGKNIRLYCELVGGGNLSPIQTVLSKGNEETKKLAEKVRSKGFSIFPILHPTVPKGSERLRICLHAFNTSDQIKELLTLISR